MATEAEEGTVGASEGAGVVGTEVVSPWQDGTQVSKTKLKGN